MPEITPERGGNRRCSTHIGETTLDSPEKPEPHSSYAWTVAPESPDRVMGSASGIRYPPASASPVGQVESLSGWTSTHDAAACFSNKRFHATHSLMVLACVEEHRFEIKKRPGKPGRSFAARRGQAPVRKVRLYACRIGRSGW